MERDFNEKESLSLISEMINQARNNIEVGSTNGLLVNGYSVAIVAILNFILLHTLSQPAMSFWIWLLMIPVGIVDRLLDRRRDKEALVKTHLDTVISSVWGAFGYGCALLLIVVFGLVFAMGSWMFTLLITPAIMIMTGIAIYVSAVVCRYKPYIVSACVFWVGALLCVAWLFVYKESSAQFIILALGMIIGFVIPAHKVIRKAKRHV